MELEIGGTYELVNPFNGIYVVRVDANGGDKYHVTVLEKDGEKKDYKGNLWKNGGLLENSKITRLDKSLDELQKAYEKKPKPKPKRTKDEIAVDELIEHVQRKIKLNELWELINAALDSSNYEVFLELSKEYAKLKKKVTV